MTVRISKAGPVPAYRNPVHDGLVEKLERNADFLIGDINPAFSGKCHILERLLIEVLDANGEVRKATDTDLLVQAGDEVYMFEIKSYDGEKAIRTVLAQRRAAADVARYLNMPVHMYTIMMHKGEVKKPLYLGTYKPREK
jgi:hypothetical protein